MHGYEMPLYIGVYTIIYRCNEMARAKLISIRVDTETHKKARELGLNISKICDNALKEAVAKLEAPNPKTMHNGGSPIDPEIENMAVVVQLGRTSASHADDPGSNPGDRTIKDYNT